MPVVETVNIAGLWSEDDQTVAQTDALIWSALRKTGGMVIKGFPGADQIDHWAHEGLSFFDAPDAVKEPMIIGLQRPGHPNLYRGYHPKNSTAFNNAYLDFGPEHPAPGPDLPGIDVLTEATPWPAMDGYRDSIRACYGALNAVAQTLMMSIGRSAGFQMDEIATRFAGEHSTLRFLNYPPSETAEEGALAAHRHVDASGLSLLWQAQPGLQAESQDGAFHDVPIVKDCISVHVGSVMDGLTRGKVPATPHRVLATAGPRRSMGFFLEPALAAPITPADIPRAETDVTDTYAWLLLKTLHGRDKYRDLIPDPADA